MVFEKIESEEEQSDNSDEIKEGDSEEEKITPTKGT